MIKQQRYSILNQQFIHVYFGSTHSVNSNKFIIALSPPTSHNSELTIYSAPELARSVLELKSGQAKSLGLNIDDKVTFEAKDINKYTLCRE